MPSTVQKITPPGSGFQWGAAPLFDPLDPKGFGVKGNARFTLRISEGSGGLPNVVVGAWGEGKVTLDFESQQGQSTMFPKLARGATGKNVSALQDVL